MSWPPTFSNVCEPVAGEGACAAPRPPVGDEKDVVEHGGTHPSARHPGECVIWKVEYEDRVVGIEWPPDHSQNPCDRVATLEDEASEAFSPCPLGDEVCARQRLGGVPAVRRKAPPEQRGEGAVAHLVHASRQVGSAYCLRQMGESRDLLPRALARPRCWPRRLGEHKAVTFLGRDLHVDAGAVIPGRGRCGEDVAAGSHLPPVALHVVDRKGVFSQGDLDPRGLPSRHVYSRKARKLLGATKTERADRL